MNPPEPPLHTGLVYNQVGASNKADAALNDFKWTVVVFASVVDCTCI